MILVALKFFIDDGSTDNKLLAEDWLAKNKIFSKLILFKTNRGKSSALNEGFCS